MDVIRFARRGGRDAAPERAAGSETLGEQAPGHPNVLFVDEPMRRLIRLSLDYGVPKGEIHAALFGGGSPC